MSHLEQLVKNASFEEAIALPTEGMTPKEKFLRVSAFLSLGKGKEAIAYLLSERDSLWEADPIMTMRADFEIRFLLRQFDEAEEDLEYFRNLPYVSQNVAEELSALPKALMAARASEKSARGMSLEEALETLASPTDDFALLSALASLRKQGDLEDYRGLVEEILTSVHHDDVKSYALMLLSAKNSSHEVTLSKRGKSYRLIPSKIGDPYSTPEYAELKKKGERLGDSSLSQVYQELLDIYALIRYPERIATPERVEPFFEGLSALAKTYLGQSEGQLSPEGKKGFDQIKADIAQNPPLMG